MTNKYSRGVIFQITTPHTPKIFIGSTVQALKIRLASYRRDYKIYCNPDDKRKNYKNVFEIMKHGDVEIILIKNSPQNTLDELIRDERHEIEQRTNTINRMCTQKELDDELERLRNN